MTECTVSTPENMELVKSYIRHGYNTTTDMAMIHFKCKWNPYDRKYKQFFKVILKQMEKQGIVERIPNPDRKPRTPIQWRLA